MQSFYGGPPGQSLLIKETFASRTSMELDLGRGWTSPIGVGEYVLVSYGLPDSEGWRTNSDTDLRTYESTYNSTLWQKVYGEAEETSVTSKSQNGLHYKLVSSMTGFTPRITVGYDLLDAGEDPTVTKEGLIDSLKFTFGIPRSQDIAGVALTVSSTSKVSAVTAVLEKSGTFRCTDGNNRTATVNKPILRITVPRERVFSLGGVTYFSTNLDTTNPTAKVVQDAITGDVKFNFELPQTVDVGVQNNAASNAGTAPTVKIKDGTLHTSRPVFEFTLPQSQVLQHDLQILHASEEMVLNWDESNINKPKLTFHAPKEWDIQTGVVNIVSPQPSPKVALNQYKNNNSTGSEAKNQDVKFLHLDLPLVASFKLDPNSKIGINALPANDKPDASLTVDSKGNYALKMDLPQSQVLQHDLKVLHASEDIVLNWDESDINNPKLIFHAPKEWDIQLGTLTTLRPKDKPTAILNEYKNNNASGTEAKDKDVKYLHLGLPPAASLALNPNSKVGTNALLANQDPNAYLSKDTNGNYTLTIDLPRAQNIQTGTTTSIDANKAANVSVDDSNINYPKLNFEIPKSQIIQPDLEVLPADQDMVLLWDDKSNINEPRFTFHVPKEWDVQMGTVTPMKPNDTPTAWINSYKNDNRSGNEAISHDIKYLHLGIPYAAAFSIDENSKIKARSLKANENPDAYLNGDDDGNYTLVINLPKAQVLQQGTTTTVNANQNPSFSINNSDIDKPVLNFNLPRAQVMGNPTTTIGAPKAAPAVSINNSNINSPVLNFTLPRAVQFFYGAELGERDKTNYKLVADKVPEGLEAGDYYINRDTGFIYLATQKTASETTFEYKADFQTPLPLVGTSVKTPYIADNKGELVRNKPGVECTVVDENKNTWELDFKLPNNPKVAMDANFVGSHELGVASVAPFDEETLKFKFDIPAGTQVFYGSKVGKNKYSVVVDKARIGDLYINEETGKVYEQTSMGIWSVRDGGLKGPPGDSLNIVRRYTFTETENRAVQDTDEKTWELILAELATDGDYGASTEAPRTTPDPDEIIAVTWKQIRYENGIVVRDKDNNIVYDDVSYWCYYTENGRWGRAMLTGSVLGFIMDSYGNDSEGRISDQTYSVSYINSLIGGNLDIDPDKKAYSKRQIDNLISWGTIGPNGTLLDADGEIYNSGRRYDDHETYSVEEVSDMLSWGSLSGLIEEDERGVSQQYNVRLMKDNWTYDSGNQSYVYNLPLTTLTCGNDGTVSPIISCVGNMSDYNSIYSASAIPNVGITFTSYRKPIDDIELIVIDIK